MPRRSYRPIAVRLAWVVGALASLGACRNEVGAVVEEGPLAAAFTRTSRDTGVPRDVLVGVAWVQSRFSDARGDDDGDNGGGGEHAPARVGIMGLPAERAGAAVGPEEGIAIAAIVLAELAAQEPRAPATTADWATALARYAAADDAVAGALFADEVLRVVESGVRAPASTGEVLVIVGRGKPSSSAGSRVQGLAAGADSPLVARFLPARAGHWHGGRSHAIDRVVIHTTEGSYDGAISWFRSASNPYQTSAHYVIRSRDGEITQMVREQDTAYHARDWNPRAVGIEHEAISANAAWFTDEMYRASARLTREICDRWGIPIDRQHIVGHIEVPGNDHSDPGPHWDWDYFMALVQGPVDGVAPPPPPPPTPDACGGLDYAGACDGAVLSWCDGGSVRTVDCGVDGETCGWQDDAVGNNCLVAAPQPPPVDQQTEPAPTPPPDDPCGGIDYAGVCDGATLTWCDGGLHQYDCAASGQTCGWQSDGVGNNCVAAPPPDPCNGETWHGRCDGDTLIWCDADTVRTAQCQTCGWQDDSVGNNCL